MYSFWVVSMLAVAVVSLACSAPVDYDYCVQDDELHISEPGFYGVFERTMR